MRPLPHIVIACAAVYATSRLLYRTRLDKGGAPTRAASAPVSGLRRSGEGAAALPGPAIDYRAVAVGALVPDLVDKALDRCLLRGASRRNEHTVGHTLLFTLAFFLPGMLLARRGDPRLLLVAIGAFTHLLVDPVVCVPRTLFWPVLGLKFPLVKGWSSSLTAFTQALSALVISFAAYRLWKAGRLGSLLLHGDPWREAGPATGLLRRITEEYAVACSLGSE